MTSVDLAPSTDLTPTLGADALEALLVTPRTARAWADAPVPEDVLERAYEVLRWAPTAMNTTPLRLLEVRSTEARERLAGHMYGPNADVVRSAPLSVVVAADTRWHEHLDVLAPHMAEGRAQFEDQPGMRESLARTNAWLQAGYLVVTLRAMGLDVGAMNGMDASGIDADLLAGTSWRSIMVVNAGHPAERTTERPRAGRLSPADAVRVV